MIKVMTFNVRLDVDKGANDFELRRYRIAELINVEKPDVIGFQEATDNMRRTFSEMLEGYCVLGCGRKKDYSGESAAIAYRKDKFELVALENFWLSATPSLPGSRYGGDQSSCPRITTAALLSEKHSASPFWFINTHLDHVGSNARLLGSVQLMQYISEKCEPCILTGDFNAGPAAKEIRVIVDNDQLSLVDCTEKIAGTFHDFGKMAENMAKIDYIFTNLPCDISKTYVCADDAPNGTYYSDHLAVCAYIENCENCDNCEER